MGIEILIILVIAFIVIGLLKRATRKRSGHVSSYKTSLKQGDNTVGSKPVIINDRKKMDDSGKKQLDNFLKQGRETQERNRQTLENNRKSAERTRKLQEDIARQHQNNIKRARGW